MKAHIFILVVLFIIVVVGSIFTWKYFFRNDAEQPLQERIVASVESQEIFVTNGIRHTIPLEEIIGGGPSKDGIPSIDNPKFISIEEANGWVKDEEPGIVVEMKGIARFYPYQILLWHEIVNDTIGGQRILITFCPLCMSGAVFDPIVKDERVEFGTSGKLWNANLVMYDRKTESLWSQVLGEAIVGEVAGAKILLLPFDIMRYSEWKKNFPSGEVLSRDTGAERFYGHNPYGDYDSISDTALYFAEPTDTRLPHDAFILGIIINGKAKAYATETIKNAGTIEDEFQGVHIIARYEKELDVVRIFIKKDDGTLKRINPFAAFWFSWALAHPDTELYNK